MVNEKASKWVIAIIIYFILLSSIFVVVNSFKDEFELEDTELLSSSGGSDNFEGITSICDSPRFGKGSPEFSDRYNTFWGSANDPHYSLLVDGGIINNEESCLRYVGASWVEETYLYFFGTGSYTCSGVIDTSFYNDGVVYTEIETFGDMWEEPVCGMSELQISESLCESFGCTYYSEVSTGESLEDYIEEANSVSGFLSFVNGVKSVTTLRVQFYTDSEILNGLLTFMLIWVPFLGLMLAFYELVRG